MYIKKKLKVLNLNIVLTTSEFMAINKVHRRGKKSKHCNSAKNNDRTKLTIPSDCK